VKKFINSVTALILCASAVFASETAMYSFRGASVEAARGELLVKFREDTPGNKRRDIIKKYGGRKERKSRIPGLVKISVDSQKLEEVMHRLESNPAVEYAEPNLIYRIQELPPMYDTIQELEDNQWGLAKIQAPAAWDIETGSEEIVIAVIDTGVDMDHPDLEENIWVNPEEEEDGQDKSGSGYVDDTYGWDFVNENNDPQDDNGHGTHVAGIASAAGKEVVAGVSWESRIMALKALNEDGETDDMVDIIEAIDYAADNGAHIINMSFGASLPAGIMSNSMGDAIESAYEAGCILIASAGNDGEYGVMYPASSEYVIAVGATDMDDERWVYSNYGAGLDLMAPGAGIRSAAPSGGSVTKSGTSMSAPFVSGVSSLALSYLKERGHSWEPSEIREILLTQGVSGYSDWFPDTGYGRLDAGALMIFLSEGGYKTDSMDPIAYPNPFNPRKERAVIVLSERETGELKELRIYSLTGQLVRDISIKGNTYAIWDGRNNDGSLCASGLYFFQLVTYDGSSETGKISLLR